MDMARNARACSKSVFELSGQPYGDDDPDLHTACSQTCRNFLAQVGTAELELVLVQLVRYLIRSKWFRDAMLWGCLCVAVDGERRPDLHAAANLPPVSQWGKGDWLPSNPKLRASAPLREIKTRPGGHAKSIPSHDLESSRARGAA